VNEHRAGISKRLSLTPALLIAFRVSLRKHSIMRALGAVKSSYLSQAQPKGRSFQLIGKIVEICVFGRKQLIYVAIINEKKSPNLRFQLAFHSFKDYFVREILIKGLEKC
jgi:hypothetical protein